MASTNYTTHYSIPLPLGTDLTTPMDYNEAAVAVDTALFAAETDAVNASEAAANAVDIANAASDAVGEVAADLSLEKAKIVVLQTRVASMENEIDDVRSDAEDAICAYNEPTATASHTYAIGDFFFYNDTLFKATAPIAIGDTIVANTNCVATNVMSEISTNKVGDLSDLTTTDKSSAVAAINEVNANLSDCAPLTKLGGLSLHVTPSTLVTDANGISTYSNSTDVILLGVKSNNSGVYLFSFGNDASNNAYVKVMGYDGTPVANATINNCYTVYATIDV